MHVHSNLSGPTKVVCYIYSTCREVFSVRGVCYEKFLCIYKYAYNMMCIRILTQCSLCALSQELHVLHILSMHVFTDLCVYYMFCM